MATVTVENSTSVTRSSGLELIVHVTLTCQIASDYVPNNSYNLLHRRHKHALIDWQMTVLVKLFVWSISKHIDDDLVFEQPRVDQGQDP